MKGISINDLPERYQDQVQQQLVVGKINFSSPAPHLEPGAGDALLATQKAPRPDGQVNITFLEKRHRLADPDGACVKYVLDGIVSAGVLRGDSAKEIGKVNKEQSQVTKDEREETIIEIRGN
jgi:hypothetical protein